MPNGFLTPGGARRLGVIPQPVTYTLGDIVPNGRVCASDVFTLSGERVGGTLSVGYYTNAGITPQPKPGDPLALAYLDDDDLRVLLRADRFGDLMPSDVPSRTLTLLGVVADRDLDEPIPVLNVATWPRITEAYLSLIPWLREQRPDLAYAPVTPVPLGTLAGR